LLVSITGNVSQLCAVWDKIGNNFIYKPNLAFIFCFYKFHFKNKKFKAIYNIFASNILTKTQIEQS